MKGLILGLAFLISTAAFAADPASQLVRSTLAKGQQILALKSSDARNTQMCALIKSRLDNSAIGTELLGSYGHMNSDRKGIALFMRELPSMTTTKLISAIGDGKGGQIDVDNNSYDRGNGTFEVGVTVHTSNGNAYSGKAILVKSGRSFRLRDAEYLGFSAVHYLGNDIQKKIDQEAQSNPTKPISAFMQKQMADAEFIHCN